MTKLFKEYLLLLKNVVAFPWKDGFPWKLVGIELIVMLVALVVSSVVILLRKESLFAKIWTVIIFAAMYLVLMNSLLTFAAIATQEEVDALFYIMSGVFALLYVAVVVFISFESSFER